MLITISTKKRMYLFMKSTTTKKKFDEFQFKMFCEVLLPLELAACECMNIVVVVVWCLVFLLNRVAVNVNDVSELSHHYRCCMRSSAVRVIIVASFFFISFVCIFFLFIVSSFSCIHFLFGLSPFARLSCLFRFFSTLLLCRRRFYLPRTHDTRNFTGV